MRIGNPQSLNRYAYVLNNPANRYDALGDEDGLDDGNEFSQLLGFTDGAESGNYWSGDSSGDVTAPSTSADGSDTSSFPDAPDVNTGTTYQVTLSDVPTYDGQPYTMDLPLESADPINATLAYDVPSAAPAAAVYEDTIPGLAVLSLAGQMAAPAMNIMADAFVGEMAVVGGVATLGIDGVAAIGETLTDVGSTVVNTGTELLYNPEVMGNIGDAIDAYTPSGGLPAISLGGAIGFVASGDASEMIGNGIDMGNSLGGYIHDTVTGSSGEDYVDEYDEGGP